MSKGEKVTPLKVTNKRDTSHALQHFNGSKNRKQKPIRLKPITRNGRKRQAKVNNKSHAISIAFLFSRRRVRVDMVERESCCCCCCCYFFNPRAPSTEHREGNFVSQAQEAQGRGKEMCLSNWERSDSPNFLSQRGWCEPSSPKEISFDQISVFLPTLWVSLCLFLWFAHNSKNWTALACSKKGSVQ
jgi:hypothetical protein